MPKCVCVCAAHKSCFNELSDLISYRYSATHDSELSQTWGSPAIDLHKQLSQLAACQINLQLHFHFTCFPPALPRQFARAAITKTKRNNMGNKLVCLRAFLTARLSRERIIIETSPRTLCTTWCLRKICTRYTRMYSLGYLLYKFWMYSNNACSSGVNLISFDNTKQAR